MEAPTLADALRAWRSRDARTGEEERANLRTLLRTVRALAKGWPLSPEAFAAATGLAPDEIPGAFSRLREAGFEFDGDGNLVGAALTLRPSPHRFRVGGRDLFAWCSLDTLFLPGLLDEPAQVESICPVTGQTIRLYVMPERVAWYTPPTTVASVVLPGVACDPQRTGPTSALCGQMFFFASPGVGHAWARDHPGVAILTVEEAFELARLRFIEPARRAEQPSGAASPRRA